MTKTTSVSSLGLVVLFLVVGLSPSLLADTQLPLFPPTVNASILPATLFSLLDVDAKGPQSLEAQMKWVRFHLSEKDANSAYEAMRAVLKTSQEGPVLALLTDVLTMRPVSQSLSPQGLLYTSVLSPQIQDIVLEQLSIYYLSLQDFVSFDQVRSKIKSPVLQSRLIRYFAEALIKKGSVSEAMDLLPLIKHSDEKDLVYAAVSGHYAALGAISAMNDAFGQMTSTVLRERAVYDAILKLLNDANYAEASQLQARIQEPVLKAQTQFQLVSFLAAQGKFESAFEASKQIDAVYYRDEALSAIAISLAGTSQFDQAISLTQRIETEEFVSKAYYAIALSQAKSQKMDEMIETSYLLKKSPALYLEFYTVLGKEFITTDSYHYALLRLKQAADSELQEQALSRFLISISSVLPAPKMLSLIQDIRSQDIRNKTYVDCVSAYMAVFNFEDAFLMIKTLPYSSDTLILLSNLAEAWVYNTKASRDAIPFLGFLSDTLPKYKMTAASTGRLFGLSRFLRQKGLHSYGDTYYRHAKQAFLKLPEKEKRTVLLQATSAALSMSDMDLIGSNFKLLKGSDARFSFGLDLMSQLSVSERDLLFRALR